MASLALPQGRAWIAMPNYRCDASGAMGDDLASPHDDGSTGGLMASLLVGLGCIHNKCIYLGLDPFLPWALGRHCLHASLDSMAFSFLDSCSPPAISSRLWPREGRGTK